MSKSLFARKDQFRLREPMFRLLLLMFGLLAFGEDTRVVVGSKAFTEGYILAEIGAQAMGTVDGIHVSKRLGIGGTGLLVEAIRSGKIDVYPEYTGTIAAAILKNHEVQTF